MSRTTQHTLGKDVQPKGGWLGLARLGLATQTKKNLECGVFGAVVLAHMMKSQFNKKMKINRVTTNKVETHFSDLRGGHGSTRNPDVVQVTTGNRCIEQHIFVPGQSAGSYERQDGDINMQLTGEMKAAKRGRKPWTFDIFSLSRTSLYSSSLHSGTGDDEKLALHMYQHLHSEFLHL